MRALKIGAAVLTVVVLLVALLAIAAMVLADRKANRVVVLDVAPVAFATDPAARERGKYLFQTRGCADCHGADGAGRIMIDAPDGLYVKTPDITMGRGSIASTYGETDWPRAVRHGLKPDGRPIRFMPSEDYAAMTDVDLADLVAYVRSLPAGPGDRADLRFPLVMKALYAIGVIPDAAERIDHAKPPTAPVRVAATIEYGAYVASMCRGCHGPALAGGKIPGAPPAWPPAADIRSDSPALAAYPSAASFATMMRTGKRPDGSEVSRVMPFDSLGKINDVELEALYRYLKRPS